MVVKPKKKRYKVEVTDMETGEIEWKNVMGVPFTIENGPGLTFFFHKFNGFYRVSEESTGNQVVAYAYDYADARERLKQKIEQIGLERLKELIQLWKDKRNASLRI
jgi:hypothetical protein